MCACACVCVCVCDIVYVCVLPLQSVKVISVHSSSQPCVGKAICSGLPFITVDERERKGGNKGRTYTP